MVHVVHKSIQRFIKCCNFSTCTVSVYQALFLMGGPRNDAKMIVALLQGLSDFLPSN